jgi:hypothetical protein
VLNDEPFATAKEMADVAVDDLLEYVFFHRDVHVA